MWDEIVKTALLGTDRANLSTQSLSDLTEKGIDIEAPLAKIILDGAALFGQLKKGALTLPSFAGKLPEFQELEQEQVCSAASAHHLSLILNGTFGNALEEFIFHLQSIQKVFPPENLPELFAACLSDPALWPRIKLIIGRRGYWLLQQNPDWQALSPTFNTETWETSNSKERIAILSNLRLNHPEKAFQLLKRSWEKASFPDRKGFIKTLKINLSLAEESFLEKCLDDRRKEIRQEAAKLLAILNGSRLIKRLFEALSQFLYFSETGHAQLDLPEEMDTAWVRDGILPTPKESYRGGMKASWVAQMIERIPPEYWEKHFQLAPRGFITAFVNSRWNSLVLPALLESCLRHRDSSWAEALVRHWFKMEEKKWWQNRQAAELMALLSKEAFNDIIIYQIKTYGPLIAEDSLVFHMLKNSKNHWDDRLSLLIIKGFQNSLKDAKTFFWNFWHFKEILNIAAYRCNPDLLDRFKTGWHYQSKIWDRWEKDVELFLRTLMFRKQMIIEMTKNKINIP